MADTLEFVKTGSETFTVAQVLEDKVSSLVARMYDAKELLGKGHPMEKVIEGWRHELCAIRAVLYDAEIRKRPNPDRPPERPARG